jgi:hypothetical protein
MSDDNNVSMWRSPEDAEPSRDVRLSEVPKTRPGRKPTSGNHGDSPISLASGATRPSSCPHQEEEEEGPSTGDRGPEAFFAVLAIFLVLELIDDKAKDRDRQQ